jgi:hypothetical protein
MFEKLNSLFVVSPAKSASEKSSQNESEETKKCQKCLRRIDLKYVTCPHCRAGDFHFDNN